MPQPDRTSSAATTGLPDDLARVLRDPTIKVPQDEYRMPDGRTLWEHLEEWRNAPSNTADLPHVKPPTASPIETIKERQNVTDLSAEFSFLHETGKEWPSPNPYIEAVDKIKNAQRQLRAGVDNAQAEADRAWSVLDWLAENNPTALELCPYKAKR